MIVLSTEIERLGGVENLAGGKTISSVLAMLSFRKREDIQADIAERQLDTRERRGGERSGDER